MQPVPKEFICLLFIILIPAVGAFPAAVGHARIPPFAGTAATFNGYRAFFSG
jgi:hypothetical protein